jgi:hypothetical protein
MKYRTFPTRNQSPAKVKLAPALAPKVSASSGAIEPLLESSKSLI